MRVRLVEGIKCVSFGEKIGVKYEECGKLVDISDTEKNNTNNCINGFFSLSIPHDLTIHFSSPFTTSTLNHRTSLCSRP